MYVVRIPNRNSNPTYLIRESYREHGKVKNRTIANITKLPMEQIEAIKRILKGVSLVPVEQQFSIIRSLPHGHVAATLGMLKALHFDTMIASKRSRERDIVVAMVVSRILHPTSKLATAQGLKKENAFHSLSQIVEIEDIKEAELYRAMDWLLKRQKAIEKRLVKKHMQEGSLFLYDITSTYVEGKKCPLAAYGHNRDGKKGKQQVVIGLLCNKEGCPVSVKAYEGNTSDSKTLVPEIKKIREEFGIQKIVMVGDRGMITNVTVDEVLRDDADLEWISALRSSSIKKLVENKELEMSLFDDWGLAEITSQEYPGERLIVCKNPLLAYERKKKRRDLIAATLPLLDKIKEAVEREKRKLKGKEKIGEKVGRVVNRYNVRKFFNIDITDSSFEYSLKEKKIRGEEALDGIYIVRTSISKEELSANEVVATYKDLSKVEQAFRSLKTLSLKVRPINHYLTERVRAHIFICMLSYYIEWHLRQKLASVLYIDEEKAWYKAMKESAVHPTERSESAKQKDMSKQTEDGVPVHSFKTLFNDLATLTKNEVRIGESTVYMYSQPTAFQKKIFDELGFSYQM